MRYSSLIFDFNGVLLWDIDIHLQAWVDYTRKVTKRSLTKDKFEEHMNGKDNKQILEYLFGRDVSDEEVKSCEDDKERVYREYLLSHPERLVLSPGAEKLLDSLMERSIPTTIATSSPKENVDFYLEHLNLEKWFARDKIVFQDGSMHAKPQPDIYEKASRILNIPPEKCVVIEDAQSGIIAAQRANIGKVVLLEGPAHHSFPDRISVDERIKDLSEVDVDAWFNQS